MSPDGKKIALVMPGKGRATGVVIVDIASGVMKPIYGVDGVTDQISNCYWVGSARLACQLWGVMGGATAPISYSGVVAVDDSGANVKLLSRRQRLGEIYMDTRGGGIVDLLPDEQGAVLMARAYAPEMQTGTIIRVDQEGMAVDRIDTRNGTSRTVLQPDRTAVDFVTDGHGLVRIRGHEATTEEGYARGRIAYQYRPAGSSDWKLLSVVNYTARTGFNPYAVDRGLNLAYGLEPVDGRDALVSYKLDGTLARAVVFKHPAVDVGGLIQIGRARRVVGVSYTTERNHAEFFDPDMLALQQRLEKALGGNKDVTIIDTSADERKAVVWAGSDTDPGRYYFLDRDTNKLALLTESNPELAGIELSPVRSIAYRAKDGTEIPAYLTIPKNSSGKALPAIVLPHGGPESRDYWGYDFLSQYFAARGFAVIQPEFRGSAGFGSAWFQKNGFRGWRTSIGDVADAGHYLVSSGIADPNKLCIFGWSYGGYAALQANVLEPGLFKAAVAVAPVTDLGELRASSRDSTDYLVEQERIGGGANLAEGSPARNADKITAPVLMFQGTYDLNVPVAQSRLMDAKLRAAGKRSELVIFDKLEHSLRDPAAREKMLQRSGDFLAAAGK
ncbi:MAG: S9 family peptidase [Sphingomonadales bacterium]|nr:S9 family peptidase [Sphingomonadales bacterium]